MKAFNFYLLLCIFLVNRISAQSPLSLNSNLSLTELNPSFSGSTGGVRNQLNYVGYTTPIKSHNIFKSNYIFYLNGLDFYVPALKAGIGIKVFNEKNPGGTIKTSGCALTYAQNFNLNKNTRLIPSVQFGYGRKIIDKDWFVGASQDLKSEDFSLKSGLLLNYKDKLYAGVTYLPVRRTVYNEPPAVLSGFAFHASYTWQFNEGNFLQIFGRHDYSSDQAAINVIFKKYFMAGIGMGHFTGSFISLGVRNQIFAINVCHDPGFGLELSRGLWQLQASFNLRNKEKRTEFSNFETF